MSDMDLDLDKLTKLTPEQRQLIPHLILIERMREDELVANTLLRQTYYGAWGEHGNGRNQ